MKHFFIFLTLLVSSFTTRAQFGGAIGHPNIPEPSLQEVIFGLDITNFSTITYILFIPILIFIIRSLFYNKDEYTFAIGVFAIAFGIEYVHTGKVLKKQAEEYHTAVTESRNQAVKEVELEQKRITACNFDVAYNTAVKFIEKRKLRLIKQSNNTNEDGENCTISYGFYVKKMYFDEGTLEWQLSDKVYFLSIQLKKYDSSIFGIETANLIDEANMTQQNLI